MSDGAAAVLLARRSKAEELGLPILGVLRSYAVVGVPPDIMGIGPAYAIPAALQKAGERPLLILYLYLGLECAGFDLWVLWNGGGSG